MANSETGAHTLVGAVSFGYGCARVYIIQDIYKPVLTMICPKTKITIDMYSETMIHLIKAKLLSI